MDKIPLIIQDIEKEFYNLTKRENIGITDILKCPYIPENEEPKILFGNIIDKHIKEIFNKYEIITDYSKIITYKNLTFTIHPDGIDNENIYEIKSVLSITTPKLIHILQILTYTYFTNRNKAHLFYISPNKINVYEFTLDKLLEFKDILENIFDKYIKKEPYTELCKECFIKHKCSKSIIKDNIENLLKENDITVERYYVLPYALPKEGIAIYKNFIYEFKRR